MELPELLACPGYYSNADPITIVDDDDNLLLMTPRRMPVTPPVIPPEPAETLIDPSDSDTMTPPVIPRAPTETQIDPSVIDNDIVDGFIANSDDVVMADADFEMQLVGIFH